MVSGLGVVLLGLRTSRGLGFMSKTATEWLGQVLEFLYVSQSTLTSEPAAFHIFLARFSRESQIQFSHGQGDLQKYGMAALCSKSESQKFQAYTLTPKLPNSSSLGLTTLRQKKTNRITQTAKSKTLHSSTFKP